MKAKDKNERDRGTQKRKGKYKEIKERREETKEKKNGNKINARRAEET